MTTYKGINGFAVQSVATDPSPLDEGQVWYNNATYAFKLASVTTAGTWASGGNLNTARYHLAGAGSQTETLAFGGFTGTANSNVTEEYNGSSWTSGGNMGNSTRDLAGAGTQTAALAMGGANPGGGQITTVEAYNGTSWTSATSLNTAQK
jgi:hypothetical protein